MKKCSSCKLFLSDNLFSKDKSRSDGFANKCKPCVKEYQSQPSVVLIKRAAQRKYAKSEKGKKTEKKHAPIRRQRSKKVGRHYAMGQVYQAIQKKKLTRTPCERCGDPCSQAHHDSYARPLDVKWLCPVHHMERHKEMKLEMVSSI